MSTANPTQFLFGIVPLDPEQAEMFGVNFLVEVTTEDFFKQHGHIQDEYNDHEYDELIAVMNKHLLFEASESSFEPGNPDETPDGITAKLNAELNFQFSQKFQDFINH